MIVTELSEQQSVSYQQTGKLTTDHVFYDNEIDFLYLSLRKKEHAKNYFSNQFRIADNIAICYEFLPTTELDLVNQLEKWTLGKSTTNTEEVFLGDITKLYTGIQISDFSKMTSYFNKIPFVDVHQFPFIDDANKECLYIIVNFERNDDPFNYIEDEYKKINDDISILWNSCGKVKQIFIKTIY